MSLVSLCFEQIDTVTEQQQQALGLPQRNIMLLLFYNCVCLLMAGNFRGRNRVYVHVHVYYIVHVCTLYYNCVFIVLVQTMCLYKHNGNHLKYLKQGCIWSQMTLAMKKCMALLNVMTTILRNRKCLFIPWELYLPHLTKWDHIKKKTGSVHTFFLKPRRLREVNSSNGMHN